mgnify:CR=1 FL=1
MTKPFDIAVIGGGAAGCAAAEEAARLGARVTLIERNRLLGGASWLRGRMPARMLQEVAARMAQRGPEARTTDVASVELAKLLPDLDARRKAHSQQLSDSLTEHRVLRLHARARLAGDGHIDLTSVRGEQHRILARHIILATGDRTVSVRGARIDHELVLDPGSALSAVYLPRTLAIVGGSRAAVEMAGLFSSLGTETTLIVAGTTLLPDADESLREGFLSSFRSAGGKVLWRHKVVKAGKDGEGGARCTVRCSRTGAEETFDVDRIIVAARREATGRSLGLEPVGVTRNEAGLIEVNSSFRTASPGIYAVGAAIGAGTSPARVIDQAKRAVHAAMGTTNARNDGIPNDPRFVDAILTVPELATVGVREAEVPDAQVATVFDGGCGLKLVADTGRRVVGLHAWGRDAERRLEALAEVVQGKWSLARVADNRGAAFERIRQAAGTLLSKRRDLDELVIDPDDLLAGIVPSPTGTSAA